MLQITVIKNHRSPVFFFLIINKSILEGKIDTKFKLKNKSTFSPKSEELSPHQEKESNNSRDEGIIEEDEDEIYYNEE